LPIGLRESASYEERVLRLAPGDQLYCYTDGITEAATPAGEQFGRDRLLAALQGCRGVPLRGSVSVLLEVVEQWCGGCRLKDDASVLAVEVGPAPTG
jgi:sigma-B regulation protein RsbU (phosphoserine phosphatase)